MKNKSKNRRLSTEILPILGFAIGRETFKYEKKKRTELTLLFLCWGITLATTRYKMVRAVDVETSDL